MSRSLPPYDKMSVAFPGVVSAGCVLTAPNLDNSAWAQFDIVAALQEKFDVDVRALNDAIVQGLGVVGSAAGLKCVLTIGTGLGCAIFRDQKFLIQLELGQHCCGDDLNYDQYIGHKAYMGAGRAVWNRRVATALASIGSLINFDRLYLGGGNARRIDFKLQDNVTLIPRTAGVTGGARLWHEDTQEIFKWASQRPESNGGAL